MADTKIPRTIDTVAKVLEKRAQELAKQEGKAGTVGKVIKASTKTYGAMSTLTESDAYRILDAAAKLLAKTHLKDLIPTQQKLTKIAKAFVRVTQNRLRNPVGTAKAAVATVTLASSCGGVIAAAVGTTETGFSWLAIGPAVTAAAKSVKTIMENALYPDLKSGAAILTGVELQDTETHPFKVGEVLEVLKTAKISTKLIEASEKAVEEKPAEEVEVEPKDEVTEEEHDSTPRPTFYGFED